MLRFPQQVQARAAHRGSAILEFALLLSLLMMLFIGILELGRAWFSYSLLTHAVREAARRASIKPALAPNDAEILSRIDAILRQGGLTPAGTPRVTFTTPLQTGQLLSVSAQVNFSPVIGMIFPNGGRAAIPLKAEVITRYEI